MTMKVHEIINNAAKKSGIKLGWVPEPFEADYKRIDCHELSYELLGAGLNVAVVERTSWCRENCNDVFEVRPRRTAPEGSTYHTFWFKNLEDAILFVLRWSPKQQAPNMAL